MDDSCHAFRCQPRHTQNKKQKRSCPAWVPCQPHSLSVSHVQWTEDMSRLIACLVNPRPAFTSFEPRFMAGLILMHLSVDLIVEALFKPRQDLDQFEYYTVVAITLAGFAWFLRSYTFCTNTWALSVIYIFYFDSFRDLFSMLSYSDLISFLYILAFLVFCLTVVWWH